MIEDKKPEFVTFETDWGKVTFTIHEGFDDRTPVKFTEESLATAQIEMIDITGDKETTVLNNIP